jgi:hypothetical protein
MNKTFIFIFLILSISLVSADLGYSDLTKPKLEAPLQTTSSIIIINDSTFNVNNSDYLDGYDSSAFAKLNESNTFLSDGSLTTSNINSIGSALRLSNGIIEGFKWYYDEDAESNTFGSAGNLYINNATGNWKFTNGIEANNICYSNGTNSSGAWCKSMYPYELNSSGLTYDDFGDVYNLLRKVGGYLFLGNFLDTTEIDGNTIEFWINNVMKGEFNQQGLTVTGNLTAQNLFGNLITGNYKLNSLGFYIDNDYLLRADNGVPEYTLGNPTYTGRILGDTVEISGSYVDINGNILNQGYNITSTYFKGNGSLLTGLCLTNGTGCPTSSGGMNYTNLVLTNASSIINANVTIKQRLNVDGGILVNNTLVIRSLNPTMNQWANIYYNNDTSNPADGALYIQPNGNNKRLFLGNSTNLWYALVLAGVSNIENVPNLQLNGKYIGFDSGTYNRISSASTGTGTFYDSYYINEIRGQLYNTAPQTHYNSATDGVVGFRKGKAGSNAIFYGNGTAGEYLQIDSRFNATSATATFNVTNNGKVFANNTIYTNQMLNLKAITLPTCDGTIGVNGSIARNSTKLYFCDGTAWNGLY